MERIFAVAPRELFVDMLDLVYEGYILIETSALDVRFMGVYRIPTCVELTLRLIHVLARALSATMPCIDEAVDLAQGQAFVGR